MIAGAARPNPQGTFNVTNVSLSQTFILQNSGAEIQGHPRYVVNNVSYLTPNTPLKLADYLKIGSQVYNLVNFRLNLSMIMPHMEFLSLLGITRGG